MRILKCILVACMILFVTVSVDARGRGGYRHSSYKSSGTGSSHSSVRVKGYTKKNGTHVNSYKRSKGNKTQKDNWSTKGNINPSTEKVGTKGADH